MKKQIFSIVLAIAMTACGGGGSSSGLDANVENYIDVDYFPSNDAGRTSNDFFYADSKGNRAIDLDEVPGKVRNIFPFVNDRALIESTEGSYFIDTKGKVVIDCNEVMGQHTKVYFNGFSEGIAFIGFTEHIAINPKGEKLFDVPGIPQSRMLNGFAEVLTSEGKCMINNKGEVVYAKFGKGDYIFKICSPRSNFIVLDDQDGFYDLTSGKKVMENLKALSASNSGPCDGPDFNNCVAIADDGEVGIVSMDGEVLFQTSDYKQLINDGKWYKVETSDGLVGWVDKNGKVMIEPQFELVRHQSLKDIGFATGDYCYIESIDACIGRDGKEAFTPDYKPLTPFYKGRALASYDRRNVVWINTKGEAVSEPFPAEQGKVHAFAYVAKGFTYPY